MSVIPSLHSARADTETNTYYHGLVLVNKRSTDSAFGRKRFVTKAKSSSDDGAKNAYYAASPEVGNLPVMTTSTKNSEIVRGSVCFVLDQNRFQIG